MKHKEDHRFIVYGCEYKWCIHHQPKWCTVDGWKGLAVCVELAEHPQRVLILEFPYERGSRRYNPRLQHVTPTAEQLQQGISAALAAGWNPESRGKPYVHIVGAVVAT